MPHFYRDGDADGPLNMARDWALLRDAERGDVAARIYGWNSVWVTLGRFQTPESALVNPPDTRWVTRPTGGAAVLHGHDVTVGLAFPLRRSVRNTYRWATAPLIEALNAAGVPAVLAEDVLVGRTPAPALNQPASNHPACFATTSPNDIVDPRTGSKICGCALRRTSDAVLLQASIPVRPPSVDPAECIRGGVATGYVDLDVEGFADALHCAIAKLTATPGQPKRRVSEAPAAR